MTLAIFFVRDRCARLLLLLLVVVCRAIFHLYPFSCLNRVCFFRCPFFAHVDLFYFSFDPKEVTTYPYTAWQKEDKAAGLLVASEVVPVPC